MVTRHSYVNILEIFFYRLTLSFIYPLKHKKYLHVKRWGEIYCDVIRGVSFPSKSMCFFKSALFLGRVVERTCHMKKLNGFTQTTKRRSLTKTTSNCLLYFRFCANKMFEYSYTSTRHKLLDTRSNCVNLKRNV